jgi:hypothetical protein
LTWLLVSFLGACGGGKSANDAGNSVSTFKDEGVLCVLPPSDTTSSPGFPTGAQGTYAADQPVNIAVQFETCFSSSCTRNRMASCTVTAAGNTLTVTSSGSFETVDSANGCTADCGFLIARCSTASLAAGTYTVKHGAETLTFTIPSAGAAPCVGGRDAGAS